MTQDPSIREMQDEYHERHRLLQRWVLVEEANGEYSVHSHTFDGVAPPTSYPNRLAAAARVVQLLGLDMVAAQQHPESICVGTVNDRPLDSTD